MNPFASLFGIKFTKQDPKKEDRNQAVIPKENDDGASVVTSAGYYGTYLDLDVTSKSESELITRYREISLYPDCDTAIEEIVTQAIASTDDESAVELNLDRLEINDNIKDAIDEEFDNVLKLLDFENKAHDIFRRWYIDGRIYYQKIVDKKAPALGVTEVRYIDPRKIKKVRDIKKEKTPEGVDIIKTIEEFYIYNERGIQFQPTTTQSNPVSGIKISVDAIATANSGMIDQDKNVILSYLHKAIKPVNQLKMLEDAAVIYRLVRAPERRIFYVDVGNLPKVKADQYVSDIMTKYKNKVVYDSTTGEIRDDRKFTTMLEDFWLPRRDGTRGTEITTLPGGANLGQVEELAYFQNKLYQALGVPYQRIAVQGGTPMNFGRQAEISRDELKFEKFVSRLRKKFTMLFDDLLKTQLVLKGIILEEEWNEIKEKISYKFAQDHFFTELKEAEDWRNRVDLLTQIQPFVGSYFSEQFVLRRILRLNQEDIDRMEQEKAEDMQRKIKFAQMFPGIDPATGQPIPEDPSAAPGQ